MKKAFNRIMVKIIPLNQSDVLTNSPESMSTDNAFSTPVLGIGKNSDFNTPFGER